MIPQMRLQVVFCRTHSKNHKGTSVKTVMNLLCPWQSLAISVLSMLACCGSACAYVGLATPFGDHMVLQREMPVPVWGTADAGEQVSVSFARQTKTAVADKNGAWSVKLDPLEASATGRDLVVQGKDKLQLHDVLVGEVWVCSGQSNMGVSLDRIVLRSEAGATLKREAADRRDQALAAKTPEIRVFRSGTGADPRLGKWAVCGPEALKGDLPQMGFSAVGYFFSCELHAELKVPIGAVEAAVGGSHIETWMPPATYAALPAASKTEATSQPKGLGTNYHEQVEPLEPMAVRGILWYQGEQNLMHDANGPRYADKMEAMILSWRAAWKRPELPFYYVQLPQYTYTKKAPQNDTAESLPYFREGQARALRLPHTGMVVTSDLVDDASELHPPDKWDVAHRLVLLALSKTYGHGDLVCSGPVFKSVEIRGDKAVLSFDHVGGGLVKKGDMALSAFVIAGADQKFVPANASIEGDKVIVSSPSVPNPVAVRFTWTESAVPNLFNAEGLPAAPFRTDSEPITEPAAGEKPAKHKAKK